MMQQQYAVGVVRIFTNNKQFELHIGGEELRTLVISFKLQQIGSLLSKFAEISECQEVGAELLLLLQEYDGGTSSAALCAELVRRVSGMVDELQKSPYPHPGAYVFPSPRSVPI